MAASRQVFRAAVRIHIDSQDVGGAGVQAYILPSQGDSAIGIRLPSTGNARFMFTTTQDGCTFQAGGPAISPFVSHTNVSTTPQANKSAIIQQRLAALDLMFAGLVPGANASQAAERLDYFDVGGGAGSARQHSPNSLAVMGNLLNAHGDLKAREEKAIGHANHFWSISHETHNRLLDPGYMPKALVIGERAGPGQPWFFYYQESADVYLVMRTVYKVGSLKLKTVEHNVGGTVILAYGRLWPAPQTANHLPMD